MDATGPDGKDLPPLVKEAYRAINEALAKSPEFMETLLNAQRAGYLIFLRLNYMLFSDNNAPPAPPESRREPQSLVDKNGNVEFTAEDRRAMGGVIKFDE